MKVPQRRMSQLSPRERAWVKRTFANYFDRYEMMMLNGSSLAEVTTRKISDDRSLEVYEAERESGVHRIAPEAITNVEDLPPARVGRR